ncbi:MULTISPECIES: YeiH family protein [Carnobacterium]|uniref:YeiH family protein n=1 Tax=Carnobacterium antarcticum TaxID=2126436 RepID=A0ABW4NNQ6_9LACT|nr:MULTISPECIES: putative sulfate exporter family transporter [unclassified Carnobacterium]ALV22565.1 membrane protein YeiH [Carnobacterium sp. CP1]QQP70477.1 putative sulfate exporter family transporter [Carnobacterium sp. CS13]
MLTQLKKKSKLILPGLFISIIVSIFSQYLAVFLPTMGSALIAIFIGILLGNTLLNKPSLNSGTKFSEKTLLELSIVLNGLILNFQIIKQVGSIGFIFILLQMIATIFITYWIGRAMKFNKKFSLLMGAGNAVCGSSAIGTVSPVIKANDKDKGMSITAVNIVGTFLMILLPLISSVLYHNEAVQTSALIGGTVQSIGQVIASAKLVSGEVTNLAIVFKLMRVLLIVAVALIYGKLNVNEEEPLFSKTTVVSAADKNPEKSIGIPWFIIGFFLLFILRSFTQLPQSALHGAETISNQFEIAALAAIGLRVNFSDIIKEGPKTMLYGLLIGLFQVIIAVLLIIWLF